MMLKYAEADHTDVLVSVLSLYIENVQLAIIELKKDESG